jgi:hypothetical protein
MISKEEALEQFKAILEGQPNWGVLSDSQFIEHLSVFQSWALRHALFSVERATQEFFLSTALNESSIRAHAEDREYLPRKPLPSTGLILIVNNGLFAVSIPEGQLFMSEQQLTYTMASPVIIGPGESATGSVVQHAQDEASHIVVGEMPFYEILFPADKTSQVQSFSVSVLLPEETVYQDMTYSRLFQNVGPDDLVYDEFYAWTGQIGIRFGNGVFGRKLPTGSTVRIKRWLTAGATYLSPSQSLYVVGDLMDYNGMQSDLTIVSHSAISGGAEAEHGEELRNNLHYWPIYNERLVWRDDYRFFLRRQIPSILWCKVWGEEEAEAEAGPDVDFINKIFISAYAPDNLRGAWAEGVAYAVDDTVTSAGATWVCLENHTSTAQAPTGIGDSWASFEPLEDRCMAALRAVTVLNRKYQWVAPNFVTFSLSITGQVPRTLVLATVEQAIIAYLTSNYGKDSATRRTDVFLKDLYSLINSTGFFSDAGAYFDLSITGNTAPSNLNDMVHIDMDATTIALEYMQ